MRRSLAFFIVLLLAAPAALATGSAEKTQRYVADVYQKLPDHFKRSLPKEIVEINAQMYGATSGDDVATLLKLLRAYPQAQTTPGVRLYQALFLPLESYRYFVWRASKIVVGDKSAFSKERGSLAMHMGALRVLTALQDLVEHSESSFSKAVYDYVTALPSTQAPRWDRLSEVQDFMANEADNGHLAELKHAYATVVDLMKQDKGGAFRMTLDTSLLNGIGFMQGEAFGEGAARVIDRTDLERIAALLAGNIASAYVYNMYNIDALPHYANRLAKETAVHNAVNNAFSFAALSQVLVVTPMAKTKALEDIDPAFLTLRAKGKQQASAALPWFRRSVAHYAAWYDVAAKRGNAREKEHFFLFDSEFLGMNSKEKKYAIAELRGLFGEEPVLVRNQFNGRTLRVHLTHLFEHPPANARVLLPGSFYTKRHRENAASGAVLQDYRYGQAEAMRDPTLAGLLPGMDQKSFWQAVKTIKTTASLAPVRRLLYFIQ